MPSISAQKAKGLFEVHVAVLLFGLAGLFGKLISQPSIVIVFGRVLVAAIVLSLLLPYRGHSVRLKAKKDYFVLSLLGIILAVHWATFFHAIQVSSVAIGLITFSTFPAFVVFLEPLLFRERLTISAVILAINTFVGVVLVVPSFDLGNNMTQGAAWGTASGATFAIMSLINRKVVQQYSSLVIVFYQDAIASIVLLPFVLYVRPVVRTRDVLLLILLGVVFTALAHSLFIKGMTHIKALTASIIASLESVYGIVFAALLLGEVPSLRTIIGGVIIFGAAFWATSKARMPTTMNVINE